MDSNASNNIYFKPSYRTTERGEQQGLSSEKQSLHELPQPNSNPIFSCGFVINGEAVPWNSYITWELQELRGSGNWTGLPKYSSRREGRSLALSTRMQNWLPLLLWSYRAISPWLLFLFLLQNTTKGIAKAVSTLSWGSGTAQGSLTQLFCAEKHFGAALLVTQRWHILNQGLSRDCKVLDIHSHYEDLIQSPTY